MSKFQQQLVFDSPDRRADVFSMVLKLQDYKERVVFWSNLKSVPLPVAQLANFVRA